MGILLFLAAWELVSAGWFFTVTYPELDAQLVNHTLAEQEVKLLLGEAAAGACSSVINMFFAINLAKAHERITHVLELLFGSSLVVWHNRVVEWLATINYVAIWERLW